MSGLFSNAKKKTIQVPSGGAVAGGGAPAAGGGGAAPAAEEKKEEKAEEKVKLCVIVYPFRKTDALNRRRSLTTTWASVCSIKGLRDRLEKDSVTVL